MFGGDSPALREVTWGAQTLARRRGDERVGAEHLLVSLAASGRGAATVLAAHGLGMDVLRQVTEALGLGGAASAADRALLNGIGIDIDGLLDGGLVAVLDTAPGHEPLFPLGARAARRRSAHRQPRLGADYVADYEASLRLALGRRERDHRPEHLALTLAALDAGARWMISAAGADPDEVTAQLARAFPPPERTRPLRIERRMARSSRARSICTRYKRRTGHVAAKHVVADLISH